MSLSTKYPRTLHFPFSPGTSSDDRILPAGYLNHLLGLDLVMTEKLDGQNNCMNKYGVFARSHTSPTEHEWDKPLWQRYHLIKNDLKDLEIFGENMYGIHSIEYKNLESYYYVFAVRENGVWLSWEEVKFYAAMLDFPVVPEINIQVKLGSVKGKDENDIVKEWFKANIGRSIEDYVESPGMLGGFDPKTMEPSSEGFVVRNSGSFGTNDGNIHTESNEFNNVFKYVRKKHVKTDVHWTKTWKPAKLSNYDKYHWTEHQYLSLK
jgi:hypothetical protein